MKCKSLFRHVFAYKLVVVDTRRYDYVLSPAPDLVLVEHFAVCKDRPHRLGFIEVTGPFTLEVVIVSIFVRDIGVKTSHL